METRTYECENCEEEHETQVVTSLPDRSLTREEVAALNEKGLFNAIIGFDYHDCDAHPENAIATEELMIEREDEMLALRYIADIGWGVDARKEIFDGEDRNAAVQQTIEEMQKEVLDEGHQ